MSWFRHLNAAKALHPAADHLRFVNSIATIEEPNSNTSMTKGFLFYALIILGGVIGIETSIAKSVEQKLSRKPLYTYRLSAQGAVSSYDEALTVASLQGIINRSSPELYVLSSTNTRPQFWLDILSKDRHWLAGRKQQPLQELGDLVKLAGKRLKGAVIWDPSVPASVNVATTLAGVQDAVVLSPELWERYQSKWRLKVLFDLRGKFTGAETGSKKNDAYRWAIRECLAKGACSSHLLCLYEDAFTTRRDGDIGYVITRDWAVKNRAFVFDLSPWGDEKPGDDPNQKLGLDLDTYKMILDETLRHAGGKQMTELAGFFAFPKYSDQTNHPSIHKDVPTEWETVWLISPYNCYQNTIASDCYNQSLHSQFPRHPLKQRSEPQTVRLERKSYISILMADYDSATPLYDFLPNNWNDAGRGETPLTWGLNPNLLETYPDLFSYYYETASSNDTFTADASAAGYMNPNRIRKEFLPLFVQHNQTFFREADMTMAPMVLDRDQPTPEVKDAFQQFAPDGYATIIDPCGGRGGLPPPQVWKGMPILELFNETCNTTTPDELADVMAGVIRRYGDARPGFYFFRCVWLKPSVINDAVASLKRRYPELNGEIVAPQTLFSLFKESRKH